MKESGYVSKTGRVESSESDIHLREKIAAIKSQRSSTDILYDCLEPEGTAIHDDGEKEPIHLIPPEAMMALAKVYRYGAKKYTDPRNWEQGMQWSRLYSSAMRHMLKFWSGEDDDPESGLPHTWHAFWNVCALVWYREHHSNLDDRPDRAKLARGGDKHSERSEAP